VITTWGRRGTGEGQFEEPFAIAISSDQQVLVLDSATGWIQRFSTEGRFLGRFGGPEGKFSHPRGMSIDSQDVVYVADTGGARVVLYTIQGEPLGQFGERGRAEGMLLEPVDVAVDPQGRILVVDAANERILRFSATLRFERAVAAPKNVAAYGPHITMLPEGSFFLTDPERQRLVRYGPDLEVTGSLGGPEVFQRPVGIIWAAGRLLVTDRLAHRVHALTAP
jgi:sugar lactone lactonase YvrE